MLKESPTPLQPVVLFDNGITCKRYNAEGISYPVATATCDYSRDVGARVTMVKESPTLLQLDVLLRDLMNFIMLQ